MAQPAEDDRPRVVHDALRAFAIRLGRTRGNDFSIVERYGNLIAIRQTEGSDVFRVHPESFFQGQLTQSADLR
jgi:hypothetical protein